ncbi:MULTISPECIES: flagellar assembly peptidoglycan hydrolase FlgJ [unclassified Variovorax]|jgi:flagellar protein FlgJ|uniref:flagellar assembly peptidoglycan hydrolase FlgJ n=1 Tax=unclassified Variovorax TaxID=663243 RepID=UPI000F7D8DDE|nr:MULTISPECIES: flagellar assembly peptidoglycan hydrolase FlgJ [unclassified Variovorax]RSZ47246.1 flagellar assembly peptidoglycan hydrolase FlgJ [Variovorax sp. 553]RSZ48631.1 flagellar assembly peptidoglycan hydrolase FlgJ [Variovorax sp. 679]
MTVSATNDRSGALDQRFALDVQGVDALRRTVRSSPEEGLQQVSRQFEALFMGMVLKSMREATPSSGLFDSQDQKVYLSMFDQQLTQNLSGRGVGLAEAMLAQLRRSMPSGPPDAEADAEIGTKPMSLEPRGGLPYGPRAGIPIGSAPTARAGADLGIYQFNSDRRAPGVGANASLQGQVDEFVGRMGASAQAASTASGVPAPLILAQAALESGWGKREIRADDGTQSFNLFGIKADRGWKGATVETTTTEYVDGEPQKVRAKFRAYASYEEAFTDYARFITRNPRYANVLATDDPNEAAHGLQRAGYATDPRYGEKLVRIMQKFG